MDGKPASFGDVVNGNRDGNGQDGDERDSHGEAQRLGPPVETVQVEDLGDPYQRGDVVESVVDKEEKPKVDLDFSRTVTGGLAGDIPRGAVIVVFG